MTDTEIKERIRQRLMNGIELSSALPTAPGQDSRLTYCVALGHRCAACGGITHILSSIRLNQKFACTISAIGCGET